MTTITRTVIFDPKLDDGTGEADVRFYGSIIPKDDGIGAYEFNGERGYDRKPGAECVGIEWDEHLYTFEQNEIITRFIEANSYELGRELGG